MAWTTQELVPWPRPSKQGTRLAPQGDAPQCLRSRCLSHSVMGVAVARGMGVHKAFCSHMPRPWILETQVPKAPGSQVLWNACWTEEQLSQAKCRWTVTTPGRIVDEQGMYIDAYIDVYIQALPVNAPIIKPCLVLRQSML